MDAIVIRKDLIHRYRPKHCMNLITLLTAAAASLLLPTPASAMNRCEDREGRVTYTNEPCPPNTRLARRIDTTPAVVSQDPRGSRTADNAAARDEARSPGAATRDGKESRDEARTAGKEASADRAAGPPERPVGPSEPPRLDSGGRIQPEAPTAPANPEQEIQRLDDLRLRQERQCADLNRRIQFTRTDLATAVGTERASIELQLRRLEEDARSICP